MIGRYDYGKNLRVLFPEFLDHLDSVHVGKAEINNENIVFLTTSLKNPAPAVLSGIYQEFTGSKAHGERFANGGLIVYYKNSIH